MNPADFRWDPWTDTAQPTDITNERRTIPASSPYDIRLWEVPQKAQPSSITVKLVDPLAVAITATDATSITVTHGAWFQNGDVILIDTEKMQVSGVSGNVLTVSRGYGGTTPSTHLLGADVFLDTKFEELSAAPSTRQYWPDYNADVAADENWNTGTLRFSSDDAGKTIAITYKGMGNLADARILRRGIEVFTENGSFTVPDLGLPTTRIYVTACGGGGGGCGHNTGGGAGACCLKHALDLTPGEVLAITVGTGGAGSKTSGYSGTASSIGSYLTLAGGGGASTNPGASGGAYAQAGGRGAQISTGSDNLYVYAHGGGNIFGPGGMGFAHTNGSLTGYAALTPGGGGGGAASTGYNGGAGNNGIVIIEW